MSTSFSFLGGGSEPGVKLLFLVDDCVSELDLGDLDDCEPELDLGDLDDCVPELELDLVEDCVSELDLEDDLDDCVSELDLDDLDDCVSDRPVHKLKKKPKNFQLIAKVLILGLLF